VKRSSHVPHSAHTFTMAILQEEWHDISEKRFGIGHETPTKFTYSSPYPLNQ